MNISAVWRTTFWGLQGMVYKTKLEEFRISQGQVGFADGSWAF